MLFTWMLLLVPIALVAHYFLNIGPVWIFVLGVLAIAPLELIAIAGVSFTVSAIASDGETAWFEGVLLVAAYVVLATAFFLVQT